MTLFFVAAVVPLPLNFSVRKRGHRCGRGCFLGRNLIEQLLLSLLGVAVAAVAGVAVLVTVHLLLVVDGCSGGVGGGVGVCCCGCYWFPIVGCWLS